MVPLRGNLAGVEPTGTEEDLERDVSVGGLDDADALEVGADPFVNDFDVGRGNEVGLVEDHEIGKGDLAHLEGVEFGVVAVGENGFGVDETGDAVETEKLGKFAVEEGHHDPGGIGDTAGFEDDVVHGLIACEHLLERKNEIVADLAADAAVGEMDGVFLDGVDEVSIDVDRTKIVDQDTDAEAVIAVEDAVEQRGLATAEKTGEERDRDRVATRDNDGLGARSRSEWVGSFARERGGAGHAGSTSMPLALSISRGLSVTPGHFWTGLR